MDITPGTRHLREIRERGALTFATVITVVVLLGAPASAAALTKTVHMGLPPSAQKQFEPLDSDVNAYFPSTVSVRVGSAVRFVPESFHTVDFPAKRGKPRQLVVPAGGKASAADAAGRRFWFRGFDVLGINPTLRAGAFGKTLRYNGSKALYSGAPLTEKPKPVTIRFTKVGTYRYFCNVHPRMSGTVRVLPKGKRVGTLAADRKTVKAQVKAALRTARALVKTRVPRGVVSVGKSGRGGVERYAFSPRSLTVPTGTRIKFAVSSASREAHTATTGPGNPETERGSYLGKLAQSFETQKLDPVAIYPSDPPTVGDVSLTPQLHGNGFWNAGVLDAFAATSSPADNSVRFRKAGVYQFHCLIHPYMHMTITVK